MKRYQFIYFIVFLFAFLVLGRLVDLQVVNGNAYLQQSRLRLVKTSAVKAPRGDILDRNGKPLVTNETVFALRLYKPRDMEDKELNTLLVRLLQLVEEDGATVTDSFPVTSRGFSLSGTALSAWKSRYKLPEDADRDTVLDFFAKRYQVGREALGQMRLTLIAQRYEMEQTGFSEDTSYTLAEGISHTLMTRLLEQKMEFPGIAIETSPVRKFVNGNVAAHILGQTGKIYKEEYEQLRDKNYAMNDSIGKQGIERYLEDALRGEDGLNRVEKSADGQTVRTREEKPSKKGDNVVLTLDLALQQSAEEALKNAIEYVRAESVNEDGEGENAACGALAAIDVNTGEILALASYPSYDPARFYEDYEALSTDPNLPMFNRAIGGAYEPGSTFKMATALAALEEGVIRPDDIIEDEGIYKYYDDYQPICWIYRGTGATHGPVNVTEALKYSCNYFFYDVGRRTTIEKMNTYAHLLGLGEATGIELTEEENIGKLASPAQTEADGGKWVPGDTLQYAIGQSKNLFTPLQLANYLATIVNGGTRYKTHIVKAVRDSETGELVQETKPTVLSEIDIAPENLRAILEGMRDVVELGTASTVFENFDVPVGGKTGTAEVSGRADNAIFVGFAPYDNPAIAVCAVIEEGVHGSNAAIAVRDVMETYFTSTVEEDSVTKTNILLP
ncbi:MAG: penicillin-binding protein 2 [Ruminococcaceae bacterium]|nr:penicillin-binding protein 2 [Oscillospiraceae bacterium]